MGNVTQCLAEPPSVRVMRPDGNVMEYDYGIQVAMLMTLFPGHLLIHCPTDPAPSGERNQFKVMEVNDRLRLGQSYIIYPIPSQYKGIFKAPSIPMDRMCVPRYLNSSLTLKGFAKGNSKVKRTRRSKLWRVKLVATPFLSLFACQPSSPVESDRECMPLLELDESTPSLNNMKRKRPGFGIGDHPSVWKPDLDDIPENPRGFHALPWAYEEAEEKSRPCLDRLQPPNSDEDLGPKIGRMIALSMSSRFSNLDVKEEIPQ